MKTKMLSPMGSLHPFLFFAVVYVVALFFSIFICSSLFYSCNASPSKVSSESLVPAEKTVYTAASVTKGTVAIR
ncbi:MAG: hypothetical protein IPP43_05120 [Chitinophagaceae bacterium]|nr:hypothetical protein [Chitinophagaceae bacterium]MBL0130559.1 hypothetical protein [Chitinophagaceae bacterium]MBL0273693.1 hypothetical protein [Chitinophagaceae bacterium]